uniref:Putative secreted protein n=1 Tax=Anopheles triannulatus TaxID=58253 RepID=A0A2M4B637_9DIPT
MLCVGIGFVCFLCSLARYAPCTMPCRLSFPTDLPGGSLRFTATRDIGPSALPRSRNCGRNIYVAILCVQRANAYAIPILRPSARLSVARDRVGKGVVPSWFSNGPPRDE